LVTGTNGSPKVAPKKKKKKKKRTGREDRWKVEGRTRAHQETDHAGCLIWKKERRKKGPARIHCHHLPQDLPLRTTDAEGRLCEPSRRNPRSWKKEDPSTSWKKSVERRDFWGLTPKRMGERTNPPAYVNDCSLKTEENEEIENIITSARPKKA